jgi:hypothetical protein
MVPFEHRRALLGQVGPGIGISVIPLLNPDLNDGSPPAEAATSIIGGVPARNTVVGPAAIMTKIIVVPVIMIGIVLVPVNGSPWPPVRRAVAPIPGRSPAHIGRAEHEQYHRPGGYLISSGILNGDIAVIGVGRVDVARITRVGRATSGIAI